MGQGGFPDPIGDGAMWARQTKNGVEYFSGNLSFSPSPGVPQIKVQFVVFANSQKQSERAPDWKIIVNTCGPAPERPAGGGRGFQPRQAPQPGPGDAGVGSQDNEDVPF